MSNSYKHPTPTEINAARDRVQEPSITVTGLVMAKWDGVGWHRSEILFGILIGLQIAEDRKRPPHPTAGQPRIERGELGED